MRRRWLHLRIRFRESVPRAALPAHRPISRQPTSAPDRSRPRRWLHRKPLSIESRATGSARQRVSAAQRWEKYLREPLTSYRLEFSNSALTFHKFPHSRENSASALARKTSIIKARQGFIPGSDHGPLALWR